LFPFPAIVVTSVSLLRLLKCAGLLFWPRRRCHLLPYHPP